MVQQSLMLFSVERSVTEEICEEAAMAYIKVFEPLISERKRAAYRHANSRDCETYGLIMLFDRHMLYIYLWLI
jgi:hypothetical protein